MSQTTQKNSKMGSRTAHGRRHESWTFNHQKHRLVEWRTESQGWADYLQFLCCQGWGSTVSLYSSERCVQGAAVTDPLGQAQRIIPAQVAHCRGAQVANKSVWETAGGTPGREVDNLIGSDSDLSSFSKGCSHSPSNKCRRANKQLKW